MKVEKTVVFTQDDIKDFCRRWIRDHQHSEGFAGLDFGPSWWTTRTNPDPEKKGDREITYTIQMVNRNG